MKSLLAIVATSMTFAAITAWAVISYEFDASRMDGRPQQTSDFKPVATTGQEE